MRIIFFAFLILALLPGGLSAQQAANPVVVIQTTAGDITIELYKDKAPLTVENFLGYVNSGFYAGTIFHRVVRNLVIQGGGLTPQLREKKTGPPIKNEASTFLKNDRGTVGAARAAGIDSATAQFFINTNDNSQFDHKGPFPDQFGYAVFGRVIEGMEIVDLIERVKVDGKNVPQSLVMITRAFVKD